jgi:medium-chain acyl-[acyl-carrier-protein] hydrolase
MTHVQNPYQLKQLRLFAFPYAGGSSNIYHDLKSYLPAEVDFCPVELPGRGRRLTEPLCENMACLVEDVSQQIKGQLDLPFAFFGYSMGSLLAYELAVRFQKEGETPVALYVAASRAPHLPRRDLDIGDLSDDEALIAKLRQLNGTPEEVWQNPELLEIVLPILRADFSVVSRYTYEPAAPLSCPVIAFGGERDLDVSEEALLEWERHSNGSFRHYIYPGDHFFIHGNKDDFFKTLSRELNRVIKEKVNG